MLTCCRARVRILFFCYTLPRCHVCCSSWVLFCRFVDLSRVAKVRVSSLRSLNLTLALLITKTTFKHIKFFDWHLVESNLGRPMAAIERSYWNYQFDKLSKGIKVFVINKRTRVRFRLLRLHTRLLRLDTRYSNFSNPHANHWRIHPQFQ